MPEEVAQFFTWTSLGTLAGATGATFVVTNTLKSAFGFSPRWLGLAVAQIICIGTAYYVGVPTPDYIVALLNGCLVYLSAAGTSSAGAVLTEPALEARGGSPPREMALRPQRPRFFSSWY